MSNVASESTAIALRSSPHPHRGTDLRNEKPLDMPFSVLLDSVTPSAEPEPARRVERSEPRADKCSDAAAADRPSTDAQAPNEAPVSGETSGKSDTRSNAPDGDGRAERAGSAAEIPTAEQPDKAPDETTTPTDVDPAVAAVAPDAALPPIKAPESVAPAAAGVAAPTVPAATPQADPEAGTAAPAAEPAVVAQQPKVIRPAAARPLATPKADPASPAADDDGTVPPPADADDPATKIAGPAPDGEPLRDDAEPTAARTAAKPAQPAPAAVQTPRSEPDQPRGEPTAARSHADPAQVSAPATSVSAGAATTAPSPSPPLGNQATAVPLAGLAVEIAAQAHAGKSRFEIRLDPPELGRIDVRLDVDRDGHVTTRLVVERPDTLDLLRRDATQLERALQQAGLKTADNALQFSLRDHEQGRDPQSADPAPHIVIAEDDTLPLDALRHGYGRLLGLGGGIDIRV